MKTIMYLVLFFILFFGEKQFAQTSIDFSNPKEVAQNFLDYFYKGLWFDAAKYCGAADCQKQIEIMMTKMALDDITMEEGKCKAVVDNIELDATKTKGKVFFTKTCTSVEQPEKKQLEIINSDGKWLINYVFKRDKYL